MQINLPHLNTYTGDVLHRGVSELFGVGFMDVVGEAAATASAMSVLQLCPYYCGIVSCSMVVQGGFVQELSSGYDLWLRGASVRLKMATLKHGMWYVDRGSGVISQLHR
jgi:hypothetical protein